MIENDAPGVISHWSLWETVLRSCDSCNIKDDCKLWKPWPRNTKPYRSVWPHFTGLDHTKTLLNEVKDQIWTWVGLNLRALVLCSAVCSFLLWRWGLRRWTCRSKCPNQVGFLHLRISFCDGMATIDQIRLDERSTQKVKQQWLSQSIRRKNRTSHCTTETSATKPPEF